MKLLSSTSFDLSVLSNLICGSKKMEYFVLGKFLTKCINYHLLVALKSADGKL